MKYRVCCPECGNCFEYEEILTDIIDGMILGKLYKIVVGEKLSKQAL